VALPSSVTKAPGGTVCGAPVLAVGGPWNVPLTVTFPATVEATVTLALTPQGPVQLPPLQVKAVAPATVMDWTLQPAPGWKFTVATLP
jgi:hypothetical protein